MLEILKYFFIPGFIYANFLLLSDGAENEYPDIIASFRAPFPDTSYLSQIDNFYEQNIPCELIMEPMEAIRVALNELVMLRKTYCLNKNESEQLNQPMSPTDVPEPRIAINSNTDNPDDDNKDINIPPYDLNDSVSTLEPPPLVSTTSKTLISHFERRFFKRNNKKKCAHQKKKNYAGRRLIPLYFGPNNEDGDYDEYYEDDVYDHNNNINNHHYNNDYYRNNYHHKNLLTWLWDQAKIFGDNSFLFRNQFNRQLRQTIQH